MSISRPIYSLLLFDKLNLFHILLEYYLSIKQKQLYTLMNFSLSSNTISNHDLFLTWKLQILMSA